MINNDLRNNFEDYIIETDGSEFLKSRRIVLFKSKKKQCLRKFIINMNLNLRNPEALRVC